MKSSLKSLFWLYLIIMLVSCAPQKIGENTTSLIYTPTNPPITQTSAPQIQATEYIKFDTGYVLQIAISPDGKKLATSNGSGIWLYDIKSKSLIWEIDYPENTSTAYVYTFFPIAWSPDSNTLASGLLNGQINLWDVNSKKQKSQLTLKNGYATNLKWSHDGKLLASTSVVENDGEHGRMNIWDINMQQSILEIPIDDISAWNIDFSPDNFFVALSITQKQHYPYGLRIWEIKSGKEHILSSGHINMQDGFQNVAWHTNSSFPGPAYGGCTGTYGVNWSPDGKSLITVDNCSGTLAIWDVESGQKKYSLEGAKWLGIWSPDGKYFANDEYSLNSIQVHLAQSGEVHVNLSCPAKVPALAGDFAGDMIWVSDSNTLLAVNRNGEICSWVIP